MELSPSQIRHVLRNLKTREGTQIVYFLMERLLSFQKTNEMIRFIVKKEGKGVGELYWAAMIKAISIKESL